MPNSIATMTISVNLRRIRPLRPDPLQLRGPGEWFKHRARRSGADGVAFPLQGHGLLRCNTASAWRCRGIALQGPPFSNQRVGSITMKVCVVSALALAVAGFASAASAQNAAASNYVQLNLGSGVAGPVSISGTASGVGSVSTDAHLKVGFFGSAMVGHSFGNGVSVEAEGYYGQNNVNSDDLDAAAGEPLDAQVKAYGGFANLKLEAPKPFALGAFGVSPYVAGGVGYGGVHGRVLGVTDSQGGFTWQVKAGLAFR